MTTPARGPCIMTAIPSPSAFLCIVHTYARSIQRSSLEPGGSPPTSLPSSSSSTSSCRIEPPLPDQRDVVCRGGAGELHAGLRRDVGGRDLEHAVRVHVREHLDTVAAPCAPLPGASAPAARAGGRRGRPFSVGRPRANAGGRRRRAAPSPRFWPPARGGRRAAVLVVVLARTDVPDVDPVVPEGQRLDREAEGRRHLPDFYR